MTTLGNYAKHAPIWDWGGVDRTPEFEFWRWMASCYGKRVLSAMAAIGEVGASMAENGFTVTALDITREMVEEGRRRFGHLEGFEFIQANLCDFHLSTDPYDFAFIGSADLHHLHTEEDVKAALGSLSRHLRSGSGLGLELWYPSRDSWKSAKQVFEPLNLHPSPEVKIWKEGCAEYNSHTKRVRISQEVFIQTKEETQHFPHELELQLYTRDSILAMLAECGYSLKTEYGNYSSEPWNPASPKWIVEAVKE